MTMTVPELRAIDARIAYAMGYLHEGNMWAPPDAPESFGVLPFFSQHFPALQRAEQRFRDARWWLAVSTQYHGDDDHPTTVVQWCDTHLEMYLGRADNELEARAIAVADAWEAQTK